MNIKNTNSNKYLLTNIDNKFPSLSDINISNIVNVSNVTAFPQKLRNIRSLIKKSSSADYKKVKTNNTTLDAKQNISTFTSGLNIKYDSVNDDVVSFDITPEEDEILESIKSNDKQDNKIISQNITNDLIEEEKPFEGLGITKIEKDESVIINTMNSISTTPPNIGNTNIPNITSVSSSFNNKLFEKIKQVKKLEKEVQEKNKVINRLKEKVDKMTVELKKKNIEKCNKTDKNEIMLMNKQLKEKEKEIEQKRKIMDNLVENYKEKISNLINSNEISNEKIEQQQNKIKILNENESKHLKDIKNYEDKIIALENQHKNLNSNFENIVKEKTKLEIQNNQLKAILVGTLQQLIGISDKMNQSNSNYMSIIQELNLFFNEDDINNNNIQIQQTNQDNNTNNQI